MCWWQGVLTVFLANLIVLVPMVLNGHPGCKYGVPFPVLSRAAFGIKGANIPSLLRAMVACGWFGIQTWIGGQAIHRLAVTLFGGAVRGAAIGWLGGISFPELACFLSFWLLQVAIIWNGIESIRDLEAWSAPILVAYVRRASFSFVSFRSRRRAFCLVWFGLVWFCSRVYERTFPGGTEPCASIT